MSQLIRFICTFIFTIIITQAANPKSCAQVKCGSGRCCPDAWLGPICFDTIKYGCPLDVDGVTATLCGAKLSVCSGICYDGNVLSCNNGTLIVKAAVPSTTPSTTFVPPIVLPPAPAPAAQTADLRIINSCNTTLWIEARWGSQGGALPGQLATSTPAAPGTFVEYVIPATGLEATRFWGKYGCDINGKGCKIGDQMQYWPNPPGGCPPGGCTPPIDSLFEATFGCKPGSACNTQNPTTWFDTSQVDGWTIPYKLVASGRTDQCDCNGSNCGFSGVDATSLDLQKCPTSEDLSMSGAVPYVISNGRNISLTSVDLSIRDPITNQVIGCMSPCKKLTTGYPSGFGLSESEGVGLWMCCPTPLPTSQCQPSKGCVTPEMCRNGPIEGTKYVDAVHRAATGVYSYSYDDGVGLHACPAGTVIYTMEFCPKGSAHYP